VSDSIKLEPEVIVQDPSPRLMFHIEFR